LWNYRTNSQKRNHSYSPNHCIVPRGQIAERISGHLADLLHGLLVGILGQMEQE